MGDTYLVTGAAGFIASSVCRQLLDAGHQVVGIDNVNAAYDPKLKRWRLAQLEGLAGFSFQEADIADRNAIEGIVEAAVSQGPIRAILNLAARAGVRPSVENPWVYFETNLVGTLNLLDCCRRHGIGKFVLASTSSAYGHSEAVPFREDADTSRPLSPYAASKKAAETLAYTYHYLHGIDVSVVRYFTVYGPAGRPDMSIFRFVRRIAEGEPLILFGDGSQNRDFTYVDDIARGTVAAIRPVGFEIINLGGDRPVALGEVIRRIGELVGREPKIERHPPAAADVPGTWASIEKARRILGWSPEVSLEEGLKRTVDWYRANRDFALTLELGDRSEAADQSQRGKS